MKYKVIKKYCDCHPETCCCDDWVVVDGLEKEWATFFSKSKAVELSNLLNDLSNGHATKN